MRYLAFLMAISALGVLRSQSPQALRTCIGCGTASGHQPLPGLYVSSSLGQAHNLGSRQEAGLTLRQGFQQAPSVVMLGGGAAAPTLWTIFPNPCRDYLDLAASLEGPQAWTAVLRDGQGRDIQRWTLGTQSLHRLELGDLPPGLYLLELRSRYEVSTHKIIRS